MITLTSLLSLVFALFGLSFLIFIHELGHYYMARRLGMKVETFSIGFGPTLYSWEHDGVVWRIGLFLFGGYVKIAGMDGEGSQNLGEDSKSFFNTSPLDRIKVAFAGPFANLVFALIFFSILWLSGGREKNFGEQTRLIGWVDPQSELFAHGVRPGDEILSYNGRLFNNEKDHLVIPTSSGHEIEVAGNHIHPHTREKTPFQLTVHPYPHPLSSRSDLQTAGILSSANYVKYGSLAQKEASLLPSGSPLEGSGIIPGDRIVWVDGVPIHSILELTSVLNDGHVLLTIERDQEIILRRVPRIRVEELKLDHEFKEELIDWQFESALNDVKIQKLFMIPYNLDNHCVVEAAVPFIDRDRQDHYFPTHPFSVENLPLDKGDRIIAVDGTPVKESYRFLEALQTHSVNIIVQRPENSPVVRDSKAADDMYEEEYKWSDLKALTEQIGINSYPQSRGNLVLLSTVVPKTRRDFALSPAQQRLIQQQVAMEQKLLEETETEEERARLQKLFNQRDEQLLIGLPAVEDAKVRYNPNPFSLFYQLVEDIGHTLVSLVSGALNPKWMSGPIGIVQLVQNHSMAGWREAIFWLGAISLNLGILNLLPLPVLDGGTICFSLYEWISGRKIQPKTLERLVLPFAILLIFFFLFLSYHDILRLFQIWR